MSDGEAVWRAGYDAGYECSMGEGEEEVKNPYPEGTSQHTLWFLGFRAAWEDSYPDECAA
jgi:hypothetical protein